MKLLEDEASVIRTNPSEEGHGVTSAIEIIAPEEVVGRSAYDLSGFVSAGRESSVLDVFNNWSAPICGCFNSKDSRSFD